MDKKVIWILRSVDPGYLDTQVNGKKGYLDTQVNG